MDISKTLHDVAIGAGAIATAVLTTVPDAAMTVWQTSPEFFQHLVPEQYTPVVSAGLTLLVAISRIVKAKKAKGGA